MPDLQLTTASALWGLLALIPIIILYLLKPKPKHIKFPSVMFFVHAEKSKRFKSFLKKIVRDPLLVVQLLVLAFLISAVAEPFFFMQEEENVKEEAVIVLDSSASMQSTDVAPTRFARAKEIASDIIDKMGDDSSVSVVLAENVPILLYKSLNKKDAVAGLKNAFASDAPTNLGDSMLFAKDLFTSRDVNKKIYVISDYANTLGPDLKLAKKMISQANITASLVKVSGEGGNSGIVDVKAKRFLTNRNRFYLTYTVKNFFSQDRDVESEVLMDGKSLTTLKAAIPENSEKMFVYENTLSDDEHRITVTLKGEDTLPADDTAYLYLPKVRKYKVLLVTDDGSDLYLKYALESSKDIDLKISIPPVIPRFDEGYDVVIMGELKKNFILPGTFGDLNVYAQKGGHVIFLASSELADIGNSDLEALMPVKPETLNSIKTDSKLKVNVTTDHEILSDVSLSELAVSKYVKCSLVNGSSEVADIEGSPAIAYKSKGSGTVFYVGINSNPSWTNFYYSSSFPVFWIQLINYATREESTLGVNNFKTGDYLPVSRNVSVKTPSGNILEAGNLILDEQGFYDLEHWDRVDRISASLLSEKESDIHSLTLIESFADKDFKVEKKVINAKKDLFTYLLYGVILLLLVEAFYYKRRGVL